ncbi:hypothetical protein CYMTET_28637 [Cymbomonas tetramitiformis]|uniref:tRNA-intron lyase n=1 Tax=Cymbomonas tetramitiformis TaxID=36881 RepID=A0AAE0FMF0_9CHLO|nr:hypothetical protein CYMTET_28637 [Cymbomonas tetramitiformis]
MEQRQTRFKRKRQWRGMDSDTALKQLRNQQLKGTLALGAVWILVDQNVAKLLDRTMLGRPIAADWLGAQGSKQNSDELRSFRLTLEEAFYLSSEVDCLQILRPPPGADAGAAAAHCAECTSEANLATGGGAMVPVGADVRHASESASAECTSSAQASASARNASGEDTAPEHTANEEGVMLTLHEAWAEFIRIRASFVMLFVAFRHFRRKRWLPRSGLQYGAHFVLYRRHPSECHSDYVAVVLDSQSTSEPLPLAPAAGEHFPAWTDVQATGRTALQVSKSLLYLQLQEQPGSDRRTPDCLHCFSAHEILVQRWVPQRHTMDQDHDKYGHGWHHTKGNHENRGLLPNVDAVLRRALEPEIGLKLVKEFPGHGTFCGHIVEIDTEDPEHFVYKVTYEDEDSETMDLEEIRPFLSVHGSELREFAVKGFLGAYTYLEKRLTGERV